MPTIAPRPPRKATSHAARRHGLACLLWLAAAGHAAAQDSAAEAESAAPADGKRTLLIVPYPITEPAVGNGVFAGPVWMREGPARNDGPAKTEAMGFGALWTDGGSRGMAAFDLRAWDGGRWWTTAVAADAQLRLHYDGLAPGGELDVGFGLDVVGLSLQADRSVGDGAATLGLRLFASDADLSFDRGLPAELSGSGVQSRANGFALSYANDTRDDVYSPTTGMQWKATGTVYASWLGGSFNAQALGLRWHRYGRGLGEGVLGVRAVLDASRGDQPFYLRPFVGLRGVPAMRYAGESVVSMELEHRWPVGERWDLIAFAGAGHAQADYRGTQASASVAAGGVGVRFKARKYFGLTFGIDVAQGPDGLATYIQIGNPWAR